MPGLRGPGPPMKKKELKQVKERNERSIFLIDSASYLHTYIYNCLLLMDLSISSRNISHNRIGYGCILAGDN